MTEPEGIAAGDSLERAVTDDARGRTDFESPRVDAIGRFKVLELLGEGGMGSVYAVYDAQLDRRLALKLVRGAGSQRAQERMLREAQAMAKLSHPNVVPVFEVGEHDGQLYIAMELVQGQSLRAWCETKPAWREIVHKYLDAARGLDAAHEAGLVHRDFKPDNAVIGDDGRVRVLDFGLAARAGAPKAEVAVTDGGQGDARLTETGAVLGTPAYMAPEQFLGRAVDPRTDQFSFCVALWEALFGERPFRGRTRYDLADAVVAGRVSTPDVGDVPASVHRILLRGLQPDASDRWPSLTSLIQELRRASIDRSRRRRLIGGALLATGIALASAWGVARYEVHQHDAAVARCAEEAFRSRAEVWNDDLEAQVSEGLRATALPYAEATLEHVVPHLDAYARDFETTLAEACVATEVERRWDSGLSERSAWCLEERRLALRGLVEQLGEADAAVAARAVSAASSLVAIEPCRDERVLGRHAAPPSSDLRPEAAAVRQLQAKAEAAAAVGSFADGLEHAHAALQAAVALEADALRASVRATLGRMEHEAGHYEQAESSLTDAYFEAARAGATETAVLASSELTSLVGFTLGRHAEGRNWARLATLGLDELESPDDAPLRTRVDARLAKVEAGAGQHDRALSLSESVLARHEARLGAEHPATIGSLNRVGGVLYVMGSYEEAGEIFERVLASQKQQIAETHPNVAQTLANLALVDTAVARFDSAEARYREALAIQRAALGPNHPTVAETLTNFGTFFGSTGKLAEARDRFEQALRVREQALEPTDPALAASHTNLAIVEGMLGDPAAAERHYAQALQIQEAALGKDHPDLAKTVANLAVLRQNSGDFAGSEALHARALEIRRRALGPDHADVASSLHNLAIIYGETGRPDRAIEAFERATDIRRTALGEGHPRLGVSLQGLGDARLRAGQLDGAREALDAALAIFDAHEGDQLAEADTHFAMARLIVAENGDVATARAEAERAAEIFRRQGEPSAEFVENVERWIADTLSGRG